MRITRYFFLFLVCLPAIAVAQEMLPVVKAEKVPFKNRPADDAYLSSQVFVIIPAETGPFKFKAYNPWADPLPFDYRLPFEQIKSHNTLFVPLDGSSTL